MSRPTRLRLVALLIAAALLLAGAAACGSDDDSVTQEDATTTTETTASTSTTEATTTTSEATTTTEAPTTSTTDATTTTTEAPPDQSVMLAALPWASPTDTHADPLAAANAFMEFLTATDVGTEAATWPEFVPGEFAAGDQRSGEIEYTYPGDVFPEHITPTVTVLVRQAGPDDTWWALGAVSNTLMIDQPVADQGLALPFVTAFSNSVMSEAVVLRLYANGESLPLLAAPLTGGGVFAMGEFEVPVGQDGCVLDLDAELDCDLTWPVGESATAVYTSDFGVSTIPMSFAAS